MVVRESKQIRLLEMLVQLSITRWQWLVKVVCGDIISEAITDTSNDWGISRSLLDRHSVEQMANGLCGPIRLELIEEINE